MENIYRFSSYRKYLKHCLDSSQGRGRRAALARHLNCQPGFISQVLNGDRHFSNEAIFLVANFFELNDEETDYLTHIFLFDRSGSKPMQDYYKKKVDAMRLQRQRIPLNRKQEISAEDLAHFHSRWYYLPIHILTLVDANMEPERMAKTLGVSSKVVEDALAFFENCGVLYRSGKAREAREFNFAVGRDSPLVGMVHKNFRIEAIKSVDQRKPEDSHYSRYFTASKKTLIKLQEELAEFVVKFNQIVDADKPEKRSEIVAFSFDCFNYGSWKEI